VNEVGRPVDSVFLDVNPAFERLTGLRKNEVVGRRASEVLPSVEEGRFLRDYGRVAVTGEPLTTERYSRDLDRHFAIHAYAPAPGYFVVSFQDVSDRITADGRVASSERRFRRVVEAGWDIIALVGEDGSLEYVSPSVERVLGLRPEDFAGRSVTDRVHPDDLPSATAAFEAAAADASRPVRIELRIRSAQGGYRWLETNVSNLLDDAAVDALVVVSRDVTERKAAELERLQLQRAIEQSAELVVITDPDGTIEYVNPAFERTTGYDRSEILGQNPRILKSGLQPDAFYSELWETVLAGRTWTGSFVNRRKNGSHYIQEAVITPVLDDRGRIANLVVAARDVTRERQLEEELRQSQKLEAVGRFTSGVAHDLNNILSVIGANTSLLLDGLPNELRELREQAADIHMSTQRAARMVRQLLGFSRRAHLDIQPVSVEMLVDEISSLISRLIPESIDVRVFKAPDLPRVLADAGTVEQMVANLVTNARDAMPDGGVLTIRVYAEDKDVDGLNGHEGLEPGCYVAVVVEDTGSGMDEEHVSRVFEPFFTTKPEGKGTGLGLSMTYGLARQQGGFVDIASKVGIGTRVSIWLPATDAWKERAGEVETPPVRPESDAHDPLSRTLLIVEDQSALRRAATRVLERSGYRVLTAADGEEALEILRRQGSDVDLVLSDVVMPRMGGPALAESMRTEGLNIPFVLTSGYAELREELSADAEARPFLPKPWEAKDLLSIVRRALTDD
jgi:PAS domain S-box-containing protein